MVVLDDWRARAWDEIARGITLRLRRQGGRQRPLALGAPGASTAEGPPRGWSVRLSLRLIRRSVIEKLVHHRSDRASIEKPHELAPSCRIASHCSSSASLRTYLRDYALHMPSHELTKMLYSSLENTPNSILPRRHVRYCIDFEKRWWDSRRLQRPLRRLRSTPQRAGCRKSYNSSFWRAQILTFPASFWPGVG
jgi:hypothetical protein